MKLNVYGNMKYVYKFNSFKEQNASFATVKFAMQNKFLVPYY